MPILQFKDFSAYYRLKHKRYLVALDKISLDVEEGEFLVVVGASGCGKTTLLKNVLASISLTDGELIYNGVPVIDINKKTSGIAYVSQEYSLYPQMTVYENMAFSLRMMNTPFDEIDKRVKSIAERLEIGWLLTRKPRLISGGQHQRVAIARALVKNPRFLLFDEPFSNLHPELRTEMRELLMRIHSEQQTTIIFVTHDLSETFMLADRIIVMNKGEIEQEGTPSQIRENPTSALVKDYLK